MTRKTIAYCLLMSSVLVLPSPLWAGVKENMKPPATCTVPAANPSLPKGSAPKATAQCPPRRNIVLYGTVINGNANPAAGAELRFAGDGIADTMTTNTGGDRFTFLDGGVLQARGGSFKIGPNHGNSAPSGPVNGGDYLVLSEIVPSGSGFRLKVWIETAVSREKVKEGSVEFADARQAMAIGKSTVRTYLMPLNETIDNFEKNKRESDPNMAIGAANMLDAITFDPPYASLESREALDVTLTVKDCDGTPLKGRKLKLSATGGTLDKTTVTTDGSGKAKVRYTAGTDKSAGSLVATLDHKTPPGHSNQAGNAMNLRIQMAELWLMQVVGHSNYHETGSTGIEFRDKGHGETVLEDPEAVGTGHFDHNTKLRFSFGGILERHISVKSVVRNEVVNDLNLSDPERFKKPPDGRKLWGSFALSYRSVEDYGGGNIDRQGYDYGSDASAMLDGSDAARNLTNFLSFDYANEPDRNILHVYVFWPAKYVRDSNLVPLWGTASYPKGDPPLEEFSETPDGYRLVFRKKVTKKDSVAEQEVVVTLKNLSGTCTHKEPEEKPKKKNKKPPAQPSKKDSGFSQAEQDDMFNDLK